MVFLQEGVSRLNFVVNDYVRKMIGLNYKHGETSTEWWTRGLRAAKSMIKWSEVKPTPELVAGMMWQWAGIVARPSMQVGAPKHTLLMLLFEWNNVNALRQFKSASGFNASFYRRRGRQLRWEKKFVKFFDDMTTSEVPWNVVAWNEKLWDSLEEDFVKWFVKRVKISTRTTLSQAAEGYVPTSVLSMLP